MHTTLLAFFPFTLFAGEARSASDDALSTHASLQTWLYANSLRRVNSSVVNPDNAVARLASSQAILDTRLDLRITGERADLLLQPRLLMHEERGAPGRASGRETYFTQAFGRAPLGQDLTLTAGRNLLTWGPANFRSPSNPFYFDPGRTQPLREVSGIDLASLGYSGNRINITTAYILSSGHARPRSDHGDTLLLKMDYRGSDYLISAISSKQRDEKPFFGAFVQSSLNDAVLVYSELGTGPRARPERTRRGPRTDRGDNTGSRSKPALLAGLSYTRLNGQVLSGEYLYDGHGYSRTQERRYFASATERASRLGQGGGDAGPDAVANPVRGYVQPSALLGRHYFSVLWQSNPQDSLSYWRATATANLQDRSTQTMLYGERNLSHQISVFASVLWNTGSSRSEYGSLLRSMVTVGAKTFFF